MQNSVQKVSLPVSLSKIFQVNAPVYFITTSASQSLDFGETGVSHKTGIKLFLRFKRKLV